MPPSLDATHQLRYCFHGLMMTGQFGARSWIELILLVQGDLQYIFGSMCAIEFDVAC